MLAHRTEVEDLNLGQILDSLSGRSHALLIVFLSFPCATPLSIPGTGGPFGVALAFISLYLMLGRDPWIPVWFRERRFQKDRMLRVLRMMIRISKWLEKLLHPRLPLLSTHLITYRFNTLYVFMMSLLLSLPVPVPVPFSNQVVAIPILLVGLGLLERDGLFILFGYLAGLVCAAYYIGIVVLGDAMINNAQDIWNWVVNFF